MVQQTLPLSARMDGGEVELGVDLETALKECARCLRCDYRGEDQELER